MKNFIAVLTTGDLSQTIGRYSDLILAFLIVIILAMLIVPVPPFILDILMVINISISVILLILAIYIPNALHLASFPSLLLVTTLFRLGLNVSTTRLILLEAHAGEVVKVAFGNFVVQGNLVVGIVMFLVLTIINFLVITKGAERVSEVAARFTLDAMPGKQMSIDADLRAGAFDMDEARRRRNDLSRESQLHGSMDGAMKFVKGDAVAGLIITAINIIAGVIIGTTMLDMEASEALNVYAILTVGDGLVSQIPAHPHRRSRRLYRDARGLRGRRAAPGQGHLEPAAGPAQVVRHRLRLPGHDRHHPRHADHSCRSWRCRLLSAPSATA
jgi:type III secretion protein V